MKKLHVYATLEALGYGAMSATAIATAVVGAGPLGLGTVTTTPARLLMWAATSSWNTRVPVLKDAWPFEYGRLHIQPVTRVSEMLDLAFQHGIFPCAGNDPARSSGVTGYATVHQGGELLALLGVTPGREWLIWYPDGSDAVRNWRLVSALVSAQVIPGLYAPYAQPTGGPVVDLDSAAFIARAQVLLREALIADEAEAELSAEADAEAEAEFELQLAQNF